MRHDTSEKCFEKINFEKCLKYSFFCLTFILLPSYIKYGVSVLRMFLNKLEFISYQDPKRLYVYSYHDKDYKVEG